MAISMGGALAPLADAPEPVRDTQRGAAAAV
jgi:hypothetical protein